MEKPYTPLSINVIYWITEIAFYLFSLVGIIASILFVAIWLGFDPKDLQLHAELPMQVDVIEIGKFDSGGKLEMNVEIVDAFGKIHFIDTPLIITRAFTVALTGIIIIFFAAIWNFRKFIVNVKKGIYFDIQNIKYLKKVSYSLIIFWIYLILYTRLILYFIGNYLEFETIRISSSGQDYVGILLFALFIWVLTHIFYKGVSLQEEHQLTI